ncbi:MAG: FHA domain-containing protein [Anaerolineae bacterium]|nr:FHA domain-containing protein [Anaerolineae bacterium]
MAFGKLTILGEGSEFDEVELTKPTTSIGRQPGNDIVLNTSAVSRYHAQFDVAEGKVFLVDLGTVNGTFVNDRQIEPNSRRPLSDGDVIMMGDVQIIYHIPTTRFRAIDIEASLAPSTTTFDDPHVPIRLIVDDPQQPVAPGSHSQLVMIIHNRSDSDRVFTIETGGMDAEWVKVNRREAHLEPDEQTEIMFSIRPPRSISTRPGLYPLSIRVAFKDDPRQGIDVTREVEIAGFAGVAIAAHDGKQAGHYHLAIQNQGNMPADLRVEGYQRERLLQYKFNPPRLRLEPGETAQVDVRVRPVVGRPFRRARQISFAIVVRSLDKACYWAPLPARYTIAPSWPAWLAGLSLPLILLGGLVTLVLVAGLFFLGIVPMPSLWGGDNETAAATESIPPTWTLAPIPTSTIIPTPVVSIVDFQAQPTEVDFGLIGLVVFSWRIESPSSVAGYTLMDNTTGQILVIAPEHWSTGRLVVSVGTLASAFGWDRHDYTLTITGTDGVERSRTAAVTIRPVICTLNEDTEILPFPDVNAVPVPVVLADIPQIAIGGRTSDGHWLQVWNIVEHRELGWVLTEQASCPSGVAIENFVIVEATSQTTLEP